MLCIPNVHPQQFYPGKAVYWLQLLIPDGRNHVHFRDGGYGVQNSHRAKSSGVGKEWLLDWLWPLGPGSVIY